jgi:hypothetical protein
MGFVSRKKKKIPHDIDALGVLYIRGKGFLFASVIVVSC